MLLEIRGILGGLGNGYTGWYSRCTWTLKELEKSNNMFSSYKSIHIRWKFWIVIVKLPGLCKRKEISSGYSVAEVGVFVFLEFDTFELKGDLKLEFEVVWFGVDVKFTLSWLECDWELMERKLVFGWLKLSWDRDVGVIVMEPEI